MVLRYTEGGHFWSLKVTALVGKRWHSWKVTPLESHRGPFPIGPENPLHFINELLTFTDLLTLFCFHGFIGVLINNNCTYLMCDLISVKHNFNKNDEYSHSSQKSLCNAICLKEKMPIYFLSLVWSGESGQRLRWLLWTPALPWRHHESQSEFGFLSAFSFPI